MTDTPGGNPTLPNLNDDGSYAMDFGSVAELIEALQGAHGEDIFTQITESGDCDQTAKLIDFQVQRDEARAKLIDLQLQLKTVTNEREEANSRLATLRSQSTDTGGGKSAIKDPFVFGEDATRYEEWRHKMSTKLRFDSRLIHGSGEERGAYVVSRLEGLPMKLFTTRAYQTKPPTDVEVLAKLDGYYAAKDNVAEATAQIIGLTQKNTPIKAFLIEYQNLADRAGWTDETTKRALLTKLNKHYYDVASAKSSDPLDVLIRHLTNHADDEVAREAAFGNRSNSNRPDSNRSSFSRGNRRGRGGRGGASGGARDNEDKDSDNKKDGYGRRDLSKITCFECGKKGHYKDDCPDTKSVNHVTGERRSDAGADTDSSSEN